MQQQQDYTFDPAQEYIFYPRVLSRQASYEALTMPSAPTSKTQAALYDPAVRKQVAKLRPRKPYFLIFMTTCQIILLLASMYLNFRSTGSFIQTKPFNYLIGPSSGVMITMGARYIPCMKPGTGYDTKSAYFACPLGIASKKGDGGCTLADVCDMNGISPFTVPNQWWRFITAIGLHGGVIHLLFNLSFQVQGGFDLEKDMGALRMALIYFISGAGGFIFGAGLSDVNSASVGASGSLYDLIQNWTIIKNPWIELAKMVANILFSLMIGTLPYIDNLAHVGGFMFGIMSGLLIMPKIYYGKWDRRRKQFLMLAALPALGVCFYIFLSNFYHGDNFCTFCKYFNCIPGMPWCDQKFTATTYVNVTTTASS